MLQCFKDRNFRVTFFFQPLTAIVILVYALIIIVISFYWNDDKQKISLIFFSVVDIIQQIQDHRLFWLVGKSFRLFNFMIVFSSDSLSFYIMNTWQQEKTKKRKKRTLSKCNCHGYSFFFTSETKALHGYSKMMIMEKTVATASLFFLVGKNCLLRRIQARVLCDDEKKINILNI